MMRHLIVCCDGTWSTPKNRSVTNVCRLYDALADTDEHGNRQLRFYQPGVGATRYRFLGGGFGLGLSDNVVAAYRWLTGRYEPGDRVWLFGFSRGAYTVRSLGGMVSACGLIDTAAMDERTTDRTIRHVYDQRYRRRGDRAWRRGLTFRFDPDDAADIPVHFIGVWDTVGALGIPNYMGWLNLLDPAHRHDFHDLRLNPYIKRGRHAVALDERRTPYVPTLWAEPFGEGQDVRQVWFPGAHSDVGGGHVQTGLSDGALQWMIEQVRGGELGLGFQEGALDRIRPDPLDVLHGGDLQRLYEVAFQPRPRAVPKIAPAASDAQVHSSAYRRQQHPPAAGPYRPTRVLAPGETHAVEVFAGRLWNETGLYLEPGEYDFAAAGRWWDGHIKSGPDGTTGPDRFNPLAERLRLAGTLLGHLQNLFRAATGNKIANVVGARREVDLPWMSLVGVVANDAIPVNGEFNAHERIAIGTGARHRVSKSGYLYTFANDAWGCYGNNRGSVHLTVTMTSS